MAAIKSGREVINAGFDEVDHLRDLLWSARETTKKVIENMDRSDYDFRQIEERYESLDRAFGAVDELAHYLS